MKKIAILGSTGSIGTQTLDVVRSNGDLEVVAISAGVNIELLEKQIREFKPQIAAVMDADSAQELRLRVADTPTKVLSEMQGLIEVALHPESELLVTALVGMIGIRPTLEAVRAGKDIALANKETLVTAGHLIMPLVREKQVRLLPVDSEHSAIFQALRGEAGNEIHKILLTASGGPFRNFTKEQLTQVTIEDTLRHPNWSMGAKITVDSATMVNKGLEVIEAKWLFDVPLSKIEVVIQPQSIIHSMVEFEDGAVMAQLGCPDMRVPIQYALYYPQRRFLDTQHLDFSALAQITFEEPREDILLGLGLAKEAAQSAGSMPTVLNAANEKAVSLFLKGKISFPDIYDIIRDAMEHHTLVAHPDLTTILEIEGEVHNRIESRWPA
ncbi:MAG: 1-deoxy-D-xylulose-5-phosphate reductoisomerase [Lachnospiraceae bacterium]